MRFLKNSQDHKDGTRNGKQLGTNKGNEEVVMPKQSQNNSSAHGDPLATNNTSNHMQQKGQTETQVGEDNFNNISQVVSDINTEVTRNNINHNNL